MKRTYNIGDIITVRGARYEVRDQRDYYIGYCDHCAFGKDDYRCILRACYRHFLEDCNSTKAYFKRI